MDLSMLVTASDKRGLRSKIPFGPFLALSSLTYIFFGPELIRWYIRL
jgi:leader peptidase (prepilin peptidase)/N-methyltransferase